MRVKVNSIPLAQAHLDHRGSSLITGIIILLLLSFVMSGLLVLAHVELQTKAAQIGASTSLQLTEAAIEWVAQELRSQAIQGYLLKPPTASTNLQTLPCPNSPFPPPTLPCPALQSQKQFQAVVFFISGLGNNRVPLPNFCNGYTQDTQCPPAFASVSFCNFEARANAKNKTASLAALYAPQGPFGTPSAEYPLSASPPCNASPTQVVFYGLSPQPQILNGSGYVILKSDIAVKVPLLTAALFSLGNPPFFLRTLEKRVKTSFLLSSPSPKPVVMRSR